MFLKKRPRLFRRPNLKDLNKKPAGWPHRSPGRLLAIHVLAVCALLAFVGWAYADRLGFFDGDSADEAPLPALDILSSSDTARSLASLARFREVSWVEIQAFNSQRPTSDVGDLPVVAKPAVINSTIRTRHDILQYVVAPGDTVFSLANYFNVSTASIRLSNGLTSNALDPGQTILIPPSGLNGIVHVVKAGDSLATLANSYNFLTSSMYEFNDLDSAASLPVGELIFLPNASPVAIQNLPDFITRAVISEAQREGQPLFNVDSSNCVGCVLVRAGNKVGTLGNTGWSTGPHLHIAIITHDGRRHDPWTFINQNRLVWPVSQPQRWVSQIFHAGHRALDIADREGTDLLAIADGDIIHRGCIWSNSPTGSTFGVIIDHGSYYSLYVHLQAPNNPRYSICSINRRSQYGQKSIDYSITE